MLPFPIRQNKTQKKGLSILGLDTLEVERWIAGKGKGKGKGKNKDLGKDGAVEFPIDSGDELTTSKLERSQIEELTE